MPRINMRTRLFFSLRSREKLGITQREYAMFSHVSQSLLNMIEMGKRSWPFGRNGGRLELEIALEATNQSPISVSELIQMEEWEKNEIRKAVSIIGARLNTLKVELEDMEFFSQQAIRLYQVTSRLEKTFEADSTEERCILLWKRRSREKYQKNSQIQQRLHQLDIEAMEKKKAFLEERLSENSEQNIPAVDP
jgi:transcriptional regulator with XRE-family HTH domain